ncbi:hypothetical protein C8R43DRAFT_1010554 [Mycena crocata]|nr:hypothetical protein C8R43DRAFT_1010554 [Mycena crocata]
MSLQIASSLLFLLVLLLSLFISMNNCPNSALIQKETETCAGPARAIAKPRPDSVSESDVHLQALTFASEQHDIRGPRRGSRLLGDGDQ